MRDCEYLLLKLGDIVNAHRQSVFLYNITDSIPVCCYRSKPEQSQCRIATVRRRQDRRAQELPSVISEDCGHLVAWGPRCWVIRRWVKVAVELSLEETVEGVKVPSRSLFSFEFLKNASRLYLSCPRPWLHSFVNWTCHSQALRKAATFSDAVASE